MLKRKVPSIVFLYNIFNQTYFRYFHGHYVKYTDHVGTSDVRLLQHFIDNQFHKLSFSLSRYERYLLWLFSTHGMIPLVNAVNHIFIDEYLKIKEKELDIQPFSVIIAKYIRDNNIKSWKEYILPINNFYPKIIQHYMKDKSFPFEVILYLKIMNRLPDKQKKMLKTVFRKEMYNLEDRLKLIKNNKHFFEEEMKKINEEFK